MAERYNSEWLSSGMVKVFYDGVLEFLDGGHGRRLCRPAGLARRAAVFAAALRRSGDRGRPARPADRGACDRRRRGASRARRLRGGAKANGRRDSRHRIEHIEVTTAADVPRFAELGVIASMQPPHPPGAMDFPLEPTLSRIGRQRWPLSYAWRTLKNAGARIVFASDWPVSPIDPIAGMQAAMLRKPWADGMPDQSFSLHEALAGYTVEGAYAEFMEHRKGRLKPGYLADLVVLSGDIEAVDAASLHEVQAGDDDLRRQDHLPGLTVAWRLRVEPWFNAGLPSRLPCGDIRTGTKAADKSGSKQWGVCVPDRPDRNAIEVRGVSKIFGAGRRQGRRSRQGLGLDPRERVLHAARAIRLRQDHAAQADRRLRLSDRGRDPALRRGHRAAAAVQAAGQHRLPELRAVSAHDGRREYRLRAGDARQAEGRDRRRASTRC